MGRAINKTTSPFPGAEQIYAGLFFFPGSRFSVAPVPEFQGEQEAGNTRKQCL